MADTAGVIVGVDLGKTNLRAARFVLDEHGNLMNDAQSGRSVPTPTSGQDQIFRACADAVRSVLHPGDDLNAVGIGSFGVIDPEKGTVVASGSLPFWNDVPLAARVGELLDAEVAVVNDVHAAALGHQFLRADRDENAALLQIGTSVGIGAYGPNLERLALDAAFGQIAHLPGLGLHSWGKEIGGASLSQMLREIPGPPVSIEELFAVSNGGPAADLLSRYLTSIAILSAYATIFLVPDTVLISGGIAAGLARHEERLRAEFSGLLNGLARAPELRVTPSAGAGELGAALSALGRTGPGAARP